MYCKGDNASRLRYMGHTLIDNRHGLIANAMVTTADGFAEREAAKAMINDARQATDNSQAEITLGADNRWRVRGGMQPVSKALVSIIAVTRREYRMPGCVCEIVRS